MPQKRKSCFIAHRGSWNWKIPLSLSGSETDLCVLIDHWCMSSTSSIRRASFSPSNAEDEVEPMLEGGVVLSAAGHIRARASRSQVAVISRATQLAHGWPCSSHCLNRELQASIV